MKKNYNKPYLRISIFDDDPVATEQYEGNDMYTSMKEGPDNGDDSISGGDDGGLW